MAEITAALVKSLREKTGAGMMDCKKALTENGGHMEASVDWLRSQGLAAAAKKAGRAASEGLVGIASNGTKGAIVELNVETDFVARNESFQDFVESLVQIALAGDGDVEALKAADHPAGENVTEQLTQLISTIGENMDLRRNAVLEVENGVVSTYVHNAIKPGLGRIGVLVALESTADAAAVGALGKQIAMHVAASSPLALTRDDVDADDLERERNILIEQARDSGKPEEIIEKMIGGRLSKFITEVTLLEQPFVKDPDTKISDLLREAGADIVNFVRYEVGEGIDKEELDFAKEVAAQVNT